MNRISMYCLMASLAVAMPASAHDTWAMPFVDATGHVSVEMTSGMDFPMPDHAIEGERVQRADLVSGSRRVPLEIRNRTETTLVFDGELYSDEAAIAAIALKPRDLTLEAEDVEHYLDELDASRAVRDAYKRDGKWRERYRKFAHAIVRREEGRLPPALLAPLGDPLEIVAMADPASVPDGATLRLCVYATGKPVADQFVRVVGEAEDAARTDETGCAEFRIGRGPTMATTVALRPSTQANLDWESDFATLTFERSEADADR